MEESAHIRHITAHTRGFKGRQDTLSSLRSEIEKSVSQEETPVIMVIGEHGIGKSAVMAALYSDMIEAPSKIQHAIVHFVGASHESFRIEKSVDFIFKYFFLHLSNIFLYAIEQFMNITSLQINLNITLTRTIAYPSVFGAF